MNELDDNLVINEHNFKDYFFEVKKFRPRKGQIMARYCSKAELVGGDEKGYLIDLLLTNPMGAEMGVQMTVNAFGAKHEDAISLCKEMAIDLTNGMTKDEVMAKPYKFTLEKFFWTEERYVPKDNPHWEAIKVTIMQDPEKNEEEE